MADAVTWVAILASLAMGLAGACLFIVVVKKDYLRDFEDAKGGVSVAHPDADRAVAP